MKFAAKSKLCLTHRLKQWGANAPFNSISTTQQRENMEQTTFEYEGAMFNIDFDFDEGEPETHDHPGWPANATIHSIQFNGIEMIDMLKQSVIDYMEHKIVVRMIQK